MLSIQNLKSKQIKRTNFNIDPRVYSEKIVQAIRKCELSDYEQQWTPLNEVKWLGRSDMDVHAPT